MRLSCCAVMSSGQCSDCPLTAPIRPNRQVVVLPTDGEALRNLSAAMAKIRTEADYDGKEGWNALAARLERIYGIANGEISVQQRGTL